MLFDDAAALAERIVYRRIAHQNRKAAVEHSIAHGSRDAKTFAFIRLHHKVVAFGSHQDAAICLNGLDRKIEDEPEQFGQWPVARQFVSRADQGRYVRRGQNFRFPQTAVVLDHAVEVRDHSGGIGAISGIFARIENDHRLRLRRRRHRKRESDARP